MRRRYIQMNIARMFVCQGAAKGTAAKAPSKQRAINDQLAVIAVIPVTIERALRNYIGNILIARNKHEG